MKNLRQEIVLELTECIQHFEDTGFVFLPTLEKTLVKVELFQERVNSPAICELMFLLKGQLAEISCPETKVSQNWINSLQKLLYFIENIVPLYPEN